ncbi:hypothetical protein KAX35_09500 [candidate division WOR-3 bacterium]|nr:hypothetical protein [candidate division WOR-3 bacterium]
MKWGDSDNVDYRVVDSTQWWEIRDYNKLEERAGVYIFADAEYQVKYVGKAGAGRMRDEVRSAINRGKDKDATILKALYTNSDEYAKSLEDYLIKKYKPPNNFSGKAFWEE